jgi:hypothetical protein
MIEKNEKKVLQVYEQPTVELVCVAMDVLTASTDVGGEYDSAWNT